MLSDGARLLLAALAVFRLAQLVALDDGPFRVFARFRAWAGTHPNRVVRENLGALVRCPFCLGVWFAAMGAALVLWPSRIGDAFLLVLGLAGAQAFLEGLAGSRGGEA
jgi:hypothetical protein